MLLVCLGTCAQAAEQLNVQQIVEGMREQHARLLGVREGVTIDYELKVEQTRGKELFSLGSGTKGTLAVRWPSIYGRLKGIQVSSGRTIEREGEHNFATQLGAGRDGLYLQVTPYRHLW